MQLKKNFWMKCLLQLDIVLPLLGGGGGRRGAGRVIEGLLLSDCTELVRDGLV